MIREQIISLELSPMYNDHFKDGFEYAKAKAADLAEAREKELLERQAAMITELRGVRLLEPFVDGYRVDYEVNSKDAWCINKSDIEAIINKYGA